MKFNRKKRNKAQKANEKAYVAVPEVAQKASGETLADRLKRDGVFAEANVLPVLSQLLRELQVLHAGGDLHLGLCPHNITIDDAGCVHLGEARADKWKRMAAGEAEYPLFAPDYEPLEQQAYRVDSIGPWTDLYALGATLYRLLTLAKVPEPTMILSEGEEAFELPEGVSVRLRELVFHLMKPNRRQRPQSVDELKDWILPDSEPAADEAPAAEPAAEEAPAAEPAAEEAPAAEPAAEDTPAAEPAAEDTPAAEPAAEEAPAEEPAAEEAPAAELAAEEATAAEEPAAEEAPAESESETDEDDYDDDDTPRWYNLEKSDLLTLLFVVGFTALLMLFKAFA